MKAVIQAGGKGTRLYNITKDEIPKPMAKVAGKPLLLWQVEWLVTNGILDVYIIIGHLGHVIRNYFGDGSKFGIHITYIVEKEPLGSAGGLYFLKKHILAIEDVLFIYGDIFLDIDLDRMYQFHLKKGGVATAFAHPNAHPQDSDLLEANGQQKVTGILPKKMERHGWHRNLANAAVYILKGQVIQKIEKLGRLDFEKDLFGSLVKTFGAAYAYRSTEYVKDAGTIGRLESIEKDIQSGFTARRNLQNIQKCIFVDIGGLVPRFWEGLLLEGSPLCMEDIMQALKMVNGSEYLSILVACPAYGAKGQFAQGDIDRMDRKIQTLLGVCGVYFDDSIFCIPEGIYLEDKGRYEEIYSGMIMEIAGKYHISLHGSWIVSSTRLGITAGWKTGLHTAFVMDGLQEGIKKLPGDLALAAKGLPVAVGEILNIQ